MITREFNLNLNAGRSTPLVIFANQFNSDEQWVFTLFDDSGQQYIPSSGSIVGIKADGLGIINSATVTAGKVVVDVTEQITACAGISEFELQLDNGTHGTANFKVVVEKKPSEGAEYSDSDISLIQEALDIVDTLPTGGTAGQVLTKTTNGSSWQDAQAGLPSGGTTGQVLTKTASGSAWQNAEKELPTGGSAGQVLTKTASGTTWSSVDAFPSEGTTGQVLTKATDGVAWTDAGNPTDTQVATAVSDWLDENITPTTPAVDATLTITGAAADAKKTGDEISALKSQIAQLEAIPRSVKLAMDTLFQNVAMKDDAVYSDEYATIHAWASAVKLLSISAVFDQGQNVIYETDSLDSLKQYLTVTASYDDGSSSAVSGYTLSGELTTGTSTITVLFDGKTATFDTTVTAVIYHLENRTFNNDDGINTHLKVLENDRNISMVFDADFAGQVSGSVVWKPFIVMNSSSPWEGVALQADGDSAKVIWMTKTASVPIARSYIGNAKIVITHAVGSGSMKYYYKVGSANMVSGTLTEAFSSITNTLRIGGAGATQPFNGTVNRFVVYDSVISTARINEFING